MILEVFGQPWMMTEASLKTLIAIASRDTFFSDFRKQALEARDGAPLKNARAAYTRGTVAVIPVVGPLIRHADMFSDISGATSYAALRKDLQAALDNDSVRSILFNIDSPGGEANGCFELADAIFAARSIKTVSAYVGGMGASAAYAIAAACETITCAASAELGSIGVRAGYLDDRRALDAMGLKEWVFVSSQSPHKAFDVEVEDDRARLQVVLDDLASVFVEQVARGRSVKAAEVLKNFGKGDVMVGQRAVDAGLADAIGNFEDVLTSMDNKAIQPDAYRVAAREPTMSVKRDPVVAAAPEASADNQKCSGCGTSMSGKSYCSDCYGGDDDEEDDEECKALGVQPKSTRAERLKRMSELVDFESKIATATAIGNFGHESAVALVIEGVAARAEIEKVRSDGRQAALRIELERGLAGAPGKQPTLSLGQIRKNMATALRGETKKAWLTAMEKLSADADVDKATIRADQVITAACSVPLSAEDLEAIQDYVKTSSPVAASTHIEPPRDGVSEGAELDDAARRVKAHADRARAALDGNHQPAAK
jgi:ClpP class serine protease